MEMPGMFSGLLSRTSQCHVLLTERRLHCTARLKAALTFSVEKMCSAGNYQQESAWIGTRSV